MISRKNRILRDKRICKFGDTMDNIGHGPRPKNDWQISCYFEFFRVSVQKLRNFMPIHIII